MNLEIQETRDDELVWLISQTPEICDRVTNDAWEAMGNVVRRNHVKIVVENPSNHVLLVKESEKVLGCFLFDFKGNGTFEAHTMMCPDCRGLKAIRAGKLALKHIFGISESVEKIISYCPSNLPQTLFYARWLGFHKTGLAAWSWIKNGIAHAVTIVEFERKDLPCH